MKLIVATLLMVCTLFVSAMAPTVTQKSAVHILNVGEVSMCNAFPISKDGYWVTAGHCTTETPLTIDGMPAEITEVNFSIDVAVLHSKSLSDSSVFKPGKAPKIGDPIYAIGFPGVPKPPVNSLIFFGHVSSPDMILYEELGVHKMVLHEGGGPGMSGAPIVDKSNRVISLVQGGIPYPSNIVYGPTFADMMSVVAKYWK